MPRPRHPCHTRLISPCATFAASVRGGGRGGRAAPCTPSPATTEGICHAAWRVWSLGAATAADVAHGHGLLVAREQLVVQLVGGASARARGRPGSAVTLLDSSRRGPDWRASRPEQTGAAQLRQHPPRRSSAARQHSLARQHFRGNGYRYAWRFSPRSIIGAIKMGEEPKALFDHNISSDRNILSLGD